MTKETIVAHRGNVCERTDKGHWVFKEPPKGNGARWLHWSRFFTPLERKQLEPDSPLPLKAQREIVMAAIDRMHDDTPIWTGDIRDQPSA